MINRQIPNVDTPFRLAIYPTEYLVPCLVTLFLRIQAEAIAQRQRFSVALSGSTTPVPLFRALAKQTTVAGWQKTHFFQVDERWVPAEHPDNNWHMILKELIEPLGVTKNQLHPITTSHSSVEQGSACYEQDLRHFFTPPNGGFPHFDLLLLGLGDDGHTASLFPNSPALHENRQWAVNSQSTNAKHQRVTLTLPVLNQAIHTIFLVTESSKAEICRKVISERDSKLPASLIEPQNGILYFILDEAAGSKLRE